VSEGILTARVKFWLKTSGHSQGYGAPNRSGKTKQCGLERDPQQPEYNMTGYKCLNMPPLTQYLNPVNNSTRIAF